jgi:hypothetical protein
MYSARETTQKTLPVGENPQSVQPAKSHTPQTTYTPIIWTADEVIHLVDPLRF